MYNNNLELIKKIDELKKEKNAIILAHYYQTPEVQDIADFIGDSLALSQKAQKTNASVIVFAGVKFMAETAKIICPDKKVLLPDSAAGCSLADSCSYDEFKNFIDKYPDHIVISYINTNVEIKTLTDIICTSSNAIQIVNSLPENEKIIFAPDKNLGNYINSLTGRNMVLWNGACHVHEAFSVSKILELKNNYPNSLILAHPECQKPVLLISDFIGSTSALLKFTKESNNNIFIVATESGIIHQMKKLSPEKTFIPAPSIDSSCGCEDCNFMKLITLKKIYLSLLNEKDEIIIDENIRQKAYKPIIKMLEISEKLGL
jgi:quinolinate synthase